LCVRAAPSFGKKPAVVCKRRLPVSRSSRRLIPTCALGALLTTSIARAEEPAPPPAPAAPAIDPGELRTLGRRVESDYRILASLEFGRGLRFNNPFRLATQLGETAESVSLTAAYADLGLGFTVGPPDGLQHGAAVHASFALNGVQQAVITPTYLAAYRGPHPFLAYGRIGPSFILTPDPTLGGEVGAGFAYFLTGKLAIGGELVFDVYYGAGTHHVGIATYPLLSGQLGLLFEHEILP
jgi:hypothetical protein